MSEMLCITINRLLLYLQVPELADLPELKGVSLVKGIGFEVSDPEVSGPDIFGRIVPMEAHEAASLYSEEKAGLLRNIGDKGGTAHSLFLWRFSHNICQC